ncbi:glutamate 5-kinase, partial [Klebsiella pneumoniae]|nr:glutamate 5-kinase [Klebsiella pneumoniae]
TAAQVLLTASDLGKRDRARNAQNTLDRLRLLHAVPIINENDTVATDEIRFGDNDRLAALVAHLVSADALVLLSDVDGLYDS